ncbi:MAG: hypothetical protein AAGA68_20620 [Pseudomonadota bacterium]
MDAGDIDPIVYAVLIDEGAKASSERHVVAKHQDRFAQELCKVAAAIPQDHRLARACDAVDHAMACASPRVSFSLAPVLLAERHPIYQAAHQAFGETPLTGLHPVKPTVDWWNEISHLLRSARDVQAIVPSPSTFWPIQER